MSDEKLDSALDTIMKAALQTHFKRRERTGSPSCQNLDKAFLLWTLAEKAQEPLLLKTPLREAKVMS